MRAGIRLFATAFVACLFMACDAEVDPQCLADLRARYGASCESGTECDRPLICGSLRAGEPSVCHAAIRCESSDECRGVHLCGVATVCLPTSTGVNGCLPTAFGETGNDALDRSDATQVNDVVADQP